MKTAKAWSLEYFVLYMVSANILVGNPCSHIGITSPLEDMQVQMTTVASFLNIMIDK